MIAQKPGAGAPLRWAVLATVAGCVLVLALAEYGCRLFGAAPDRSRGAEIYREFLVQNRQGFFERRRGPQGPVLVQRPSVWKAEVEQVIPLKKAQGTRRILVVGESTADRIAVVMRRLLSPDPRFEVINCANGSASVQLVERRFAECVRLEVDAIVLGIGHNVMSIAFPRWQGWLLYLAPALGRSYLLATLVRAGGQEGPTRFPAERLAELERVVEAAAREAARRKVPMIAMTMPSNSWFAPHADLSDEQDARFLKTVYLSDSGRRGQAIQELDRLVAETPTALWHFKLGGWLYREGRRSEAFRHLVAARDLDPEPRRASTLVNAAIRRAAIKGGAILFDAEEEFEAAVPDRIAGWETFGDRCHPVAPVLDAWSRRLLRRLVETGLPEPKFGTWKASDTADPLDELAEILKTISLGGPRAIALPHAVEYWLKRGGPPPAWLADPDAFSGAPLDERQRATLNLLFAEGYWRTGRHGRAWELNRKAKARDPSWEEPIVQQARFFLRLGRLREASAGFESALAMNPEHPLARLFLERLSER